MGSMVPGCEGEGRIATGYGSIDDSQTFQDASGVNTVFTESRGLEPYYLDLLNRKYTQGSANEDYRAPESFVPQGREAIMGETLGQNAVISESHLVAGTYRPQPEALGKQVGRTAESDLWRADTAPSVGIVDQITGFAQTQPVFTAAICFGLGVLAYIGYKQFKK